MAHHQLLPEEAISSLLSQAQLLLVCPTRGSRHVPTTSMELIWTSPRQQSPLLCPPPRPRGGHVAACPSFGYEIVGTVAFKVMLDLERSRPQRPRAPEPPGTQGQQENVGESVVPRTLRNPQGPNKMIVYQLVRGAHVSTEYACGKCSGFAVLDPIHFGGRLLDRWVDWV